MAIEWVKSCYGESETAALAPGLWLEVGRPIGTKRGPLPMIRAEVFGMVLRAEFETMEEAKARAIRVAKAWLARATEAIG